MHWLERGLSEPGVFDYLKRIAKATWGNCKCVTADDKEYKHFEFAPASREDR